MVLWLDAKEATDLPVAGVFLEGVNSLLILLIAAVVKPSEACAHK